MSTVGNWQGPKIVKDSSLVVYIDPTSPNCYYPQTGSTISNMGDQTFRNYTITYYSGTTYNVTGKTFDYRFRLSGGGGSKLTTDFTIQTNIYYPNNSPNTTYPYDMIFTTQVGSGTGIGIFLYPITSQAWLVLAGGTRLTLTNVPRDQWFNLAFTKEGSSLKGYYNGTLINSSTYSATNPYDPIFFGSNGGSLQLQHYYISAGDLLLYSRALDVTEINKNKTALGARFGL